MACVGNTMGSYCLLQKLNFITTGGNSTFNEYHCPLLFVSKDILMVKSVDILTDISVVHQCTEKCEFKDHLEASFVERELIKTSIIVLKHDFTNLTYYLNIYALSYKGC